MTALTLAPLRAADVRPLARLHRQAFPGFFLSTLGEPFLVQFYRGFLEDETSVTTVARDEQGAICGAVVGTIEPSGFFRRLLSNRWPGLVVASASAVLSNPKSLSRLVWAVRYRGDTPPGSKGALLSSICVDPTAQGTGVGRALIADWTRQVASGGVGMAFLTTDAVDNDSVNRFYQAQGWELAERFETREGRPMHRYTISLNGH